MKLTMKMCFSTVLPVIFLITTILPVEIRSQDLMRINLKDGSVMEFSIDDIRKLTFDTTTEIRQYGDVIGKFLTLKAYPNPARDYVNIEYTLAARGEVLIEIFSLNGRHLESIDRGHEESGTYLYKWLTTPIPSGIYVCRIRQNKEIVTEKIIIK
jgi:hypothetical protein